MTTISTNNKPVLLINVFTVDPANQRQLLDLLTNATETSVRNAPGFISAKLHRSLDGTKVTMYAQWRSVETYQAMRENPDPLPYLQKALAIAKFEREYMKSSKPSLQPPLSNAFRHRRHCKALCQQLANRVSWCPQ